jgi:predicted PurR-regulated permease PerM
MTPELTAPPSGTVPPQSLVPPTGRLLVTVAILVLLYVAYLTVRPVLVSILLAAALASLVAPIFRWMLRRFHGRRRLASICAVILTFVGVLLPVSVLVTVATQRLIVEGTELAHSLQSGGPISIERVTAHLGPLGPPVEHALADLQPKLAAATPQVVAHLGSLVAAVSRAALRIGIGMFLLGVALYYFFVDGAGWRERFERIAPLPARDTRAFFDSFHKVSVAVVVGNLGTALTQAVAATLGYYLFGAAVPLIWGAATFFAALIPLVGPAIIWVPVSVAVGVTHGWMNGVGLAAYGLLVISTVDNIVRPLLTKRGLQLHPLLVFIAVFGGVISFGAAGLLIGPLVIALVVTLLDVYERHLVKA